MGLLEDIVICWFLCDNNKKQDDEPEEDSDNKNNRSSVGNNHNKIEQSYQYVEPPVQLRSTQDMNFFSNARHRPYSDEPLEFNPDLEWAIMMLFFAFGITCAMFKILLPVPAIAFSLPVVLFMSLFPAGTIVTAGYYALESYKEKNKRQLFLQIAEGIIAAGVMVASYVGIFMER